MQIRIIGTSHVSKESQLQIERVIQEVNPTCVCVELDAKRLRGLEQQTSRKPSAWQLIRRVGVQGYVFSAFAGWAQKKLGMQLGTAPGEEMLLAVRLARKSGAKVALVDQDIEVTLRRLRLSWRERGRLVVDIVKGIFGFGEKISFDLSQVPERQIINRMLEETKERYPSLYRVLVSERNEIIARNVARAAMQCGGDIVVVIGAGHEEEVARLLQNYLSASSSS